MKRIFVTGASGFVGSHLVPQLIDSGFQVTALCRTYEEKKKINFEIPVVVGDLSQKGQWSKSLANQEAIIHLASEIAAKDFISFVRNNVIATKNLIKAAKYYEVKKIILFSSAAVTSTRLDWYAQTKKSQEAIVKSCGIDYAILRPSMIYGPKDPKNIGWLIKMVSVLPIIPLPGGGKFGRQPVFVDDIVKIVIKLISKSYGKKIFEIHGYEYINVSQMIKVICEKTKSQKLIVPVPLFFLIVFFWLAERLLPNPKYTSDQIRSLISGEKFQGDDWRKIFDIIPTRFEDGIGEMIKK